MSISTHRPTAAHVTDFTAAEVADLVSWGEIHGLEVAITPAGADPECEMALIGYGEGVTSWTIYRDAGRLWLAFIPDPCGEAFEGSKVTVGSVAEAMGMIISATEE